MRTGIILAGCILAGLVTACQPQGPIHFQLADIPETDICNIAVLPFDNKSPYQAGETIVRRIFTTQLMAMGNYQIAQEGDIFTVYQQLHIRPGTQPSIEQYHVLGDRLGVQLFITGTINEMTDTGGVEQKKPSIDININLLDAKTGQTLWTTYHKRHGDQFRTVLHFGAVNSTTELLNIVSDEILKKWFTEGLPKCTE